MGCQSEVYIGHYLTFSITTHDPDTGALTDADAPPSYRLYEDETAVPILTGAMAKLDDAGTLGFYTERIHGSLVNGFEHGKSYNIYIIATVDGDTGGIALSFRALTAPNDPTAAAIADAVWDETSAGHVGAGAAGQQLWTDVDLILADTDELQTDDTPAAIAALNDPTAAAVADAVWDEDVVAAHNAADTAGALIDDIGSKADFMADITALATAAALAIAQVDLDNPNQYKADVAALATAAALAIAQADLNNPNQYKATGFSTLTVAQVNDQVVDALNADTYAEPPQGVPLATATLAAKIGYLYKAFRNRITQTSGPGATLSIYDDAGATVDQKAPVSDDGTTYTRGKIGSGP